VAQLIENERFRWLSANQCELLVLQGDKEEERSRKKKWGKIIGGRDGREMEKRAL
jgi:hypothetical protein